MGRYWSISCPYCNAQITSGYGYGDKVPKIWAIFIRCEICGGLVKTGANEFLTMPVEERLRLTPSTSNADYIEKSLDRTNNTVYLNLLIESGFHVYPISNEDMNRFYNVDFSKYQNKQASTEATQSLHNLRILVLEENRDEATGGFKKDILQKNQRAYMIDKKAKKWGSIAGLIIGFISCGIFGSIDPNSYLFLLGVVFGFGAFALVYFCIAKYYEKDEKMKKEKNNRNYLSDNSSTRIKEKTMSSQLQNKLESLKKLYEDGIITQEEYKKQAIEIINKE